MSTMTHSSPLDRLRDWQLAVREDFPILTANPGLAYLDSAATAQKPRAVLDAVTEFLSTTNANVGRGSYPWANSTGARVAAVRERVKRALGDDDLDSSVEFVSGTSHGLRSVAMDWLPGLLTDGDEIIVPFGDHQANLTPWLEVRDTLAKQGVRIDVRAMPVDPLSRDYDHRALPAIVNERTKFVAATHVHHVYGANLNVHRIRDVVGPDVPICLDAAQSVGHGPVSVADLDVDFVVFSGHKMLALTGVGAVWARNKRGPRFELGGWAGTPNTAGIVSLQAAFDWLDAVGPANIREWTTALGVRLTDGLSRMDDVSVLGCQQSLTAESEVQRREGIVTFRHRKVRSDDLGFVLADEGIMVRADSHCQAGRDNEDRAVRVSLHAYNTPDEIDRLLAVLRRCEGI